MNVSEELVLEQVHIVNQVVTVQSISGGTETPPSPSPLHTPTRTTTTLKTKCIKYMLFFFNFIFLLAGCVILCVSLWLRYDQTTSKLLDLKDDDVAAPNTFYISVYILMAVGAVMMFVGFLGCCGAKRESQCLLGTFFACLVILLVCEVVAVIWGFIHKDRISTEVISFYDYAYDTYLYVEETDKKQAAAAVLKVFHESLQCCGNDRFTSIITGFTTGLCTENVYIPDCHSNITELFDEKIYLIGITALVVAVIMIFEMIFSMVLCRCIRNSPVY